MYLYKEATAVQVRVSKRFAWHEMMKVEGDVPRKKGEANDTH